MGARVLPYGQRALLVEVDSLRDVLDLHESLTGPDRPDALADCIPGARTLLVVASSADRLGELRRAADHALDQLVTSRAGLSSPEHPEPSARSGAADRATVIEVRYDGEDLDDVARATGLSRADVVHAHTGQDWTVGFAGFAPGFAYLVGGDPRLRVPRRGTPRPRVPAGAVALAGEFTGIYPRPSPGGWQLIGSTDAPLWAPDRTPPALLLPGGRVRFVDAGGTA